MPDSTSRPRRLRAIIASHAFERSRVPPLIRRYVKTSFVFLLAGLGLGAYVTVSQSMSAYPPRLVVTAHVHLLLVGFMLMIVMGVATWMFPRPARDDQRYRPELAETVYWVMTVSTVVRAAAELSAPLFALPWLRWVTALGGLGQVAGAGLFVLNMWWRVRMPAVAPPPR
ncbi:MAG: hypothetical protein HYS14_10465 [Candidatus Rokubacteria bacterium]|nr:hypothetical protein [Candidatus Rokubacteria bacterium]